MKKIFYLFIAALVFVACNELPEQKDNLTSKVNVFLGTSGDHGQMSPSASYPFSMLSIGPVTSPHIHTGYEYYAKTFNGFVHTHLEGVGCRGCGGNILVKPIIGGDINTILTKQNQYGEPGFYEVNFENGISAKMTVLHNSGIHKYHFSEQNNGLFIDLSYAFCNRFVDEEHTIDGYYVNGWIDSRTTCSSGVYRVYYCLKASGCQSFSDLGNHKLILTGNSTLNLELRIGFSSVNVEYAKSRIDSISFDQISQQASNDWDRLLGKIKVTGEKNRVDLFYSLLYRGLQAPYLISEPDGVYRAIDGSLQQSSDSIYNGWAIWDNYREQIPMLSLFYPEKYDAIVKSIANLYSYGKQNWATMHEPSLTVRTEHAMVVLLDAWEKGVEITFDKIKKQLIDEAENLDYGTPDKALESSYDCWALSKILQAKGDSVLADKYKNQALNYKTIWMKDFADITKDDVDVMQARGLYQGTIWQYRWFVPFDIAGLKELTGGEATFINQLNQFFAENNYNHANQPDLQVPGLYNATNEPWRSQKLFHELLLDTVVQCYFNDNSKGIDPYVGKIYNNTPRAYLRTMDDDAGTMSSWFVLRSLGLSAANVGSPVFYLTAPIFETVSINLGAGKTFKISVKNYNKDYYYIKKTILNGVELNRNWLTYNEIQNGGELTIETSDVPNKQWGVYNPFITSFR
jgi:putative alpha-1,2-mannosidase